MKKLLIHYGLPNMVNLTNRQWEAAEILNNFDEIVLASPVYLSSSDRANYFSVVNLLKDGVFVYVPMADNYQVVGGESHNEEVNSLLSTVSTQIQGIISLFNNAGCLNKLKGFFLDEFGFDFTIRRIVNNTTSYVHICRDWQNAVINYIKNLSSNYKVFVNAWFMDDAVKDFYPAQYDGNSYWGNHSVSYPAGQTALREGDYILVENPFSIDGGIVNINFARLSYVLEFLKKYSGKYKICAVNEFNFSNKVSIEYTGIPQLKIIDNDFRYAIENYLSLMYNLGFYAVGLADVNYGAGSNLVYEFDLPGGYDVMVPDDIDYKANDTYFVITLNYKTGKNLKYIFKNYQTIQGNFIISDFGR